MSSLDDYLSAMSDEAAWQERQDEKEWEAKQAEAAYENYIIETEQDWRRYEARIRELNARVAELEAENKWLKAKYERLKAIAERVGLIIDNANDEFLRELQSIKLQQKRGPDLDEWGNRRHSNE